MISINRLFTLFFLLGLCIHLQAQVCNLNYSLGPDITGACNENQTITAPPGYTYLWSTNETTQSIDVNSSGTYTCTISETQQSVVVNGDFSIGDSGFSTDYAPGSGGFWGLLSTAGQYATAANAADVHNNFAFCYDHTSGDASGSMLIVNGADLPNFKVWYQTVTVQPNTDYSFSIWAMSAVSGAPAEINLTIDDNAIGTTFFLNNNTCDWQYHSATWNSGANTSVEIAIINQSTSESGNDFAIDDIEFSPVCFFTDDIDVTIPVNPVVTVDSDMTICAGETVSLTAQSNIPGSTFTWQPGSLMGASILVSPTVDTQYSVRAISPFNCDSDPATVQLTVVDPGDYVLNLPPSYGTCSGVPVQLNSPTDATGTFAWQPSTGLDNPSIPNPTAMVYANTVYSLSYTNACGQTQTANTSIMATDISFDLGPDRTLCEGETETIILPEGPDYTWQDGSHANEYTISQSGIYMVTGVENSCTYSETLVVTVLNNVDIEISGAADICPDETATLTATAGNYSYRWSTGEEDDSILIHSGGSYSVEVTDLESGCVAATSFEVANLPAPKVSLGEYLDICMGSSKEIFAFSSNNSDLVWQDGTLGPAYLVEGEGIYSVTATTACGSIEKTIEVKEINCEQTLYIPNSFSPNGDGLNDLFKVVGQNVESFELRIYDRWGALVFISKDINNGWNGSANNDGYYASNDVYTYLVNVEFRDESIVTKRGFVNLLR